MIFLPLCGRYGSMRVTCDLLMCVRDVIDICTFQPAEVRLKRVVPYLLGTTSLGLLITYICIYILIYLFA